MLLKVYSGKHGYIGSTIFKFGKGLIWWHHEDGIFEYFEPKITAAVFENVLICQSGVPNGLVSWEKEESMGKKMRGGEKKDR